MKVPAASNHFPEEDRRAILAAMDEVLRSGQLTLGKHGAAFEDAFAARAGAAHAGAVNSETSALEIILRILGAEGREVVDLTMRELGLELVAVADDAAARTRFLDPGVTSLAAIKDLVFDQVVVTSFERRGGPGGWPSRPRNLRREGLLDPPLTCTKRPQPMPGSASVYGRSARGALAQTLTAASARVHATHRRRPAPLVGENQGSDGFSRGVR